MSQLKVYDCQTSISIFSVDKFYKVSDVEPILNSLQQLKAEITPILYQAVSMLRDYKREDVIILLDKLAAKLSAV